eukprot:UN31554
MAGNFSYADFYLRRVRRLFPALFATLLLVVGIAIVLFLPYNLERVGGALISALFWVSNFFFWNESGYFDAEASMKPLLHTWSLSVEEQFYMFWPAFLVLLFNLRRTVLLPLAILSVSILSLLFAEFMLQFSASAVFYLTPFRIYEFGIGALLVWVIHYQPKNTLWLEPLL